MKTSMKIAACMVSAFALSTSAVVAADALSVGWVCIRGVF